MSIDMHSFLGANTETGFYSLYEEFVNKAKNPYIIKGGPGTGKSTLMKKIACRAAETGHSVEFIHCSSDPDSLDGIYIKDTGTCIVDGTPPHTVEPPYPGAVGKIIDLYAFWDNAFLKKHSDEIKKLNFDISGLYERAYLYIGAAGKLQKDLNKLGTAMLNKAKFKGYFERLCSKYFKQTQAIPSEDKRFLSAITPNGYITFNDEFNKKEAKTLVIDDEYGIAARAMELIKYKAQKSGHRVIICYNPINPALIDHILIPTASLNLCTSNSQHSIEAQPYCRINISRFLQQDAEKAHKEKISFLIRARDEIINEAVKLLDICHKKHDELEEIYKTAVDFNALTEYTDKLIEQIIE